MRRCCTWNIVYPQSPHNARVIWTGTLDEPTVASLREASFQEVRIKSLSEYFPTVLVHPVGRAAPQPWLFGGRDVLDLRSWDLRLSYSDGT